MGNRDSVVGTVTICNAPEGPWVECRQGKKTFLFSVTSRPVLGPTPASYSMGTATLPGVKRPEHDVHHSPPSRADVKNECSTTPSPTIRLDRVDGTDLLLPFVSIIFVITKNRPTSQRIYCCTTDCSNNQRYQPYIKIFPAFFCCS